MHPLAAFCPRALQYQRFPSKEQNQDRKGRKKSLEALLTPLGSWVSTPVALGMQQLHCFTQARAWADASDAEQPRTCQPALGVAAF